MDNNSILEKVRKIIIDELSLEEKEISMDSNFREDLGADSLDTVETIMRIEEEFGIEIPDEEAEELKTLSDLVEYLDKKLN